MRKLKITILSGIEEELRFIIKSIFTERKEEIKKCLKFNKTNEPNDLENYIEIVNLNILEILKLAYEDYLKEKNLKYDFDKTINPKYGFKYSNQIRKIEEVIPLNFYSEKLSKQLFKHQIDIVLVDLYTNSLPLIDTNIESMIKNTIFKFNKLCHEYNHKFLNEITHHFPMTIFKTIFSFENINESPELEFLAASEPIIVSEDLKAGKVSCRSEFKKFFDLLINILKNNKNKELILR